MFRAVWALLSGGIFGKFLGVARELLLAALFGTTAPVGSYRIAQTATLVPVNFFTTDSLNAGFIPLYSRYRQEEIAKAQALFWTLSLWLNSISVVIMFFLLFSANWWVGILAPGLDASTRAMAALFLRVMAIGVPFYVSSALFSYLEMGHNGYTLASLRASVQSVGLILGTIMAFWFKKPVFLAWGFTGAYIIFLIWSVALTYSKGLLSKPKLTKTLTSEVIKELWRIMRPLLLLPIMLQGNIAIERAVASLMGVSVVAGLDYAKLINDTGTNLLAVPLGLAGLSLLSGLDSEQLSRRLEQIVTPMMMLTVPISIFLAVHSRLVIQVLYARGAFNANSVNVTEQILFGFAIGFWAQIVSYVLIKALNAQLRNREVVKYMAVALILNSLANILLYRVLGPLSLGLGESIYGIILFVYCAQALKIGSMVLSLTLRLGLGALIYILIGSFIGMSGWIGMLVSLVIWLVFWAIYFLLNPSLRQTVFGFFHSLKTVKTPV